MKINNICKNCDSRLFFPKLTHRHYSAPKEIREWWKKNYGYWPLNQFYKHNCEVCRKTMAVFDSPRRDLKDRVIVLYMCSFTDEPASEDCNKYRSCYYCPIPKEQRESGLRKDY